VSLRKYWIGVVSQSHVERGRSGGFAQLCHGKNSALKKMQTGDFLIYYSPKTDFESGVPLQAFTAVAKVTGESVYAFRMNENFIPFRRDMTYLECQSLPIKTCLDRLSFITDLKHWGYVFRTGHFEISEADFKLIAQGMKVLLND
jgi:hypothetical protein